MNRTTEELAGAMFTLNLIIEILGHSETLSVSEQVAALKRKCDSLAAESGQMLRLLTDISENHVEYYSEGEDGMFAGVPLDYVSEINMYVSRDVNAENPFKATDAALAEIQAQGVEKFAESYPSAGIAALAFAAELRKESGK
jgi:hypothetical protein